MSNFYPNMYVGKLSNIDVHKLKKEGIKALIFDLDNTLVPWNSNELLPETKLWFQNLITLGFKVCILSNNNEIRVKKLADLLKIPWIHKAAKPRKKAFAKALKLLQVEPQEAAMVGDQVFTDVLGGNRQGLYTILVVPISRKEFWGTRINRQFEKPILHRIKHLLIQ